MSTDQRNLGDVLGERCSSDETCVIYVNPQGEIQEWLCRDVEARARSVAGFLQAAGFAKGTSVGILGDNSVPYLVTYLGIMRAGCICVPINKKQPSALIDTICEDADIRFAFIDGQYSKRLPPRVVSKDLAAVTEEEWTFEPVEMEAEDTALILYTSGSTDRPKGVVLSHRSQLSMIDAITGGAEKNLFRERRGIVAAPMFHMNALVFLAAFLTAGGSVVLMSKFETRLYAKVLETLLVTTVTGVPTMIALLHSAWPDIGRPIFSLIETVYIGSAPVSEAVVQQVRHMMPNARIVNSYGTTETGGALFGPHPDGIAVPPTSVGYPRAHVDIRLAGNGHQGTLHVRAPSMMEGYLNRPDLTAERLRDGWFDTGDRFRVDENGFYYFVGRDDDMFVCSGENAYPAEVEKAIESHPSISQAAVVAIADEVRGEMPVAFVVSNDPAVSEIEIQEHVRCCVAPYLYPRRVWFCDRLPLASTTKVDRSALRKRAEARLELERQSVSTPRWINP